MSARLTETRNAFQLALLADCETPDSLTSAGAMFLLSIQTAAECHLTECGGPHDECVHEIADAAPDVCTHQRWLEFVDLQAYNEDPSDLGADWADPTEAAGVCLYIIAERLATALFGDAAESDDEDADES